MAGLLSPSKILLRSVNLPDGDEVYCFLALNAQQALNQRSTEAWAVVPKKTSVYMAVHVSPIRLKALQCGPRDKHVFGTGLHSMKTY